MLGLECSLVEYPGALQRAGIGHVAFAVRAADFHRRPVPGPGQFHVARHAGAQNPGLRRSRHQFRYHAGRRRERAERIVECNQAGKGDFVRARPFEQRPPLALVFCRDVARFVVYRKGNVILAGYNRSAASAPPEGEKCGIYYVRCCHCVYFLWCAVNSYLIICGTPENVFFGFHNFIRVFVSDAVYKIGRVACYNHAAPVAVYCKSDRAVQLLRL